MSSKDLGSSNVASCSRGWILRCLKYHKRFIIRCIHINYLTSWTSMYGASSRLTTQSWWSSCSCMFLLKLVLHVTKSMAELTWWRFLLFPFFEPEANTKGDGVRLGLTRKVEGVGPYFVVCLPVMFIVCEKSPSCWVHKNW